MGPHAWARTTPCEYAVRLSLGISFRVGRTRGVSLCDTIRTMESEILAVKELIEKLRDTDTKFRVFAADSHRYHIGPKLSATEVLDFEKNHNITLPEDYRLYLDLVGNGSGRPPRPHPYTSGWVRVIAGAGPGYGIYPLSKTVNGDRVSQPFPFEEKVDVPYEPPYDTWEENIPGALEVCTSGWLTHTHLIVNGPKYGTIWEGYNYDHFTPTNLTFIQWMRNWAEKELRKLLNEPLVKRIKVGMTKAQVIKLAAGDWQERHVLSGSTFLECADFRAQLELDADKVVIKINRD